MGHNLIPAQETRNEIKVLNSRFIATTAPVFSVEEARAFIARVKSEFADASHNVPAYVIGHGATVVAHYGIDRRARRQLVVVPGGTKSPIASDLGLPCGRHYETILQYFESHLQ